MKNISPRVLLFLSLCALSFIGCGEDKPGIFQITLLDSFDDARNIEMVQVPGGTYAMGSLLYRLYTVVQLPSGRWDTTYNFERPVHVVAVSSFQISNTEITQAQYEAVTGVNPSQNRGSPDLPVEKVNWFDAVDFCNLLSERQGLSKCYDQLYNCDFSADGFRLPTEAEWEYAARAGTTSESWHSDLPSAIAQSGWYVVNSENSTHPVANKQPNPFGLYDTSGNVSEWTNDIYGYYSCSAQRDPHGPDAGYFKSVRGGSWAGVANELRSAFRFAYPPDKRIVLVGFRIARRL